MPKYYQYKAAGYYLYFTSKCVIETGSAKFFVKDNGDTILQEQGIISAQDVGLSRNVQSENTQNLG